MPVTLDDVASLFLKDQEEADKDAKAPDESEPSLSLTSLLAANDAAMAENRGQEDLPSPLAAAVQLRGKAAEGIQRWSSVCVKETSPPPQPTTTASREAPTRGRPISELMSQLQAGGAEADKGQTRRPSPWSSSVGKRLNFREQSRQSRSLEEKDEPAAAAATKEEEEEESAPTAAPKEERREAKAYKARSSTAPLFGTGAGVAERMRQLRQSGEESWKQRVTPRTSPDRPRSQIAELQSQLIQEESDGWRRKQPAEGGGSAEAHGLTVKSKLGDQVSEEAAELLNSLLSDSGRGRAPRRRVSCSPPPPEEAGGGADSRPRSLCADADAEASSPAPEAAAPAAAGFFASFEQDDDEAASTDEPSPPSGDAPPDAAKADGEEEQKELLLAATEEAEDPEPEEQQQQQQQQQPVQLRRRPAPQNRRRGQKNPVRARAQLASRESAPLSTETPAPAAADCSRSQQPDARKSTNQGLAMEAIQGLQTKVDFESISLQKMDPNALVKPFGSMANAYKELMLIQVKGRRHAQARLVAPQPESVNSGDCYLLLASDTLYLWQGAYANVIEASKASELAKWILEKRDLGYGGSQSEPFVVRSEDADSSRAVRFWRHLGCERPPTAAAPLADEEDIVYEQLIADTNAFYRVDADACTLEPLEEHWGRSPGRGVLDSRHAVVCDFGSELYLWCGRLAGRRARAVGVRLVRSLFDAGYDYEGCRLCAVHPSLPPAGPRCCRRGPRPDWCLLAKVNEQGETVLFKEKFTDWPEARGLVGVGGGGVGRGGRPLSQSDCSKPPDWLFDACSAEEMLEAWRSQESACLELENTRLGRGGRWTEVVDGLRRSFEVVTLSTDAWLVTQDFERRRLQAESVGQLHSRNTCLVRWQYRLIAHGTRSSAVTGRERCAYFYWQGAAAGQKEKGAGALLTVQLDEERCPQVQVVEGEETPAFLSVFKGAAVVHAGGRDDSRVIGAQVSRLYLVRGHSLSESLLAEVPCRLGSLRPRGCFLLATGSAERGLRGFVWHGANTAAWYRELAAARASAYAEATPAEMRLGGAGVADWTTVGQGSETRDFLRAFGARPSPGRQRQAPTPFADPAPLRAFKFTSATRTGRLQFSLMPDIAFHSEQVTPFPYQLAAFRSLPQPANAFVLVHCGERLFLWQGWNPAASGQSYHAGSSLTRFEAEKKAVLRTALQFGELVGVAAEQQLLVFAGSEPEPFRHLFPHWPSDDQSEPAEAEAEEAEAEDAASEAAAAGRTLLSVYEQLSNLSFDLATLQRRPLPEGVDPSRLEAYLDDEEFEAAFRLSRPDFEALSDWRKLEMKKALGLY